MKEPYPGIFIGDIVILRDGYLARVKHFSLQDGKVCFSVGNTLPQVPVTAIKPWR